MRHVALTGLICAALVGFHAAASAEPPVVAMETSKGTITIELDPTKAPKTVENFLSYVDQGFYDGTIFHRVIPDFMIQGGGFTPDIKSKKTSSPVKNEADNGLLNTRGTIAMARTSAPNSATSQFFINLVDNAFLDHRQKTVRGWGYAVFGRVIDGMDVVDAIGSVETTRLPSGMADVPVSTVLIERVTRIEPATGDDEAAAEPAPANQSDPTASND